MLYYVYNNDVGENKDVSQQYKGYNRFTHVSFNGGDTWEDIATVAASSTERFRAPFSLRKLSATTEEHWIGFSLGTIFPTEEGHVYLVLCDVRNAGAAVGGKSGLHTYNTGEATATYNKAAAQTTYNRVYGLVAASTGRFYLDAYPTTAGTTCQLDVKNWRQFDVTGWTSAQITALATKENYDEVYLTLPDTFHGESNMTEEKFLEMGGMIRNDGVDGYMYVHEIGFNYSDIP